jgi:hypothetical protein
MLFRLPRVFYSPDDGGGDGGTDDGGQDKSDGNSKPEDSTGERKFTQAEINRIVESRLSKYKAKVDKDKATLAEDAVSTWRDEMGIDDDALSKITKHDDVTKEMRAIKSEATKAKNELAKTQEELKRTVGVLEDTKTREAVFSAAAGKARDPEAVFALLRPKLKFDVEALDVTILGDDGEPAHGKTIPQSIDELLAAKPFLAMPTGNPGAGSRVKDPAAAADKKPDYSDRDTRIAKLEEAFGDEK